MTTPVVDSKLSREDSNFSDMEQEKSIAYHKELLDAIGEEDSGGNVGTAAYERSKFMAEIVSPALPFRSRPELMSRRPYFFSSFATLDPRAEQEACEEDRLAGSPSVPYHS